MTKLGAIAVVTLVAAKLVIHAALIERYGWHGDELYFVECGRRLALGYVDHAPMIGWIARGTEALGGGLIALRVPAVLAGALTMVFVALLVREWRGGAVAQWLALAACLIAPAYLRMGAMLNIPVLEVAIAAAATYASARALERGEGKTWLVVGAVVGVGLLVKHSMLLWVVALAAGIALGPYRRVLATRWPWLGLALALLIFSPNLVWQATHGFATIEFLSNLRRSILAEQGRVLFAAGQLLYFHPAVAPIWIAAFAGAPRSARPFVTLFSVLFVVLLLSGAKPYYLGVAYPAMFAAGGVVLERWFAARRAKLIAYGVALGISGVGFGVITLPVLPITTTDAVLGRMLGWVVPPMALTHDLHGMLGWDVHVAVVSRVVQTLPAEERDRAFVLTGSYAQAAASNVLAPEGAVPPATSGHMTYYLWGPPEDRGDVLIAYGVSRQLLEQNYGSVTEVDRIVSPLSRPRDTDLPVYVCRSPKRPVSAWWSQVKRFGHRAHDADPR